MNRAQCSIWTTSTHNILVTQSPKYTRLKMITNQFIFVCTVVKSLYIQLQHWEGFRMESQCPPNWLVANKALGIKLWIFIACSYMLYIYMQFCKKWQWNRSVAPKQKTGWMLIKFWGLPPPKEYRLRACQEHQIFVQMNSN